MLPVVFDTEAAVSDTKESMSRPAALITEDGGTEGGMVNGVPRVRTGSDVSTKRPRTRHGRVPTGNGLVSGTDAV